MNFQIPLTGERMLFHPVLACPKCQQPCGIAIEGVYNAHGQLNHSQHHEVRAVCLYGCGYDVKVRDARVIQGEVTVEGLGDRVPVLVEGPRLCLLCNCLHVKTGNEDCSAPSYCPTIRSEK